MMKPVLYYCYDAYCGWCYGFSPVITRISEEFAGSFDFEVLSGGMIPSENPRHISAMAGFIKSGYERVEEMSGIRFGEDYLWHIFHPEESDWYPHSEKSAIALSILKEYKPTRQVSLASQLQKALLDEGRDLTDDEAYRQILVSENIPEDEFYTKLNSEEYREKAHYEFALCRQLQVSGFPAVLLQTGQSKFYLVARGYTSFDDMNQRILNVLNEVKENGE